MHKVVDRGVRELGSPRVDEEPAPRFGVRCGSLSQPQRRRAGSFAASCGFEGCRFAPEEDHDDGRPGERHRVEAVENLHPPVANVNTSRSASAQLTLRCTAESTSREGAGACFPHSPRRGPVTLPGAIRRLDPRGGRRRRREVDCDDDERPVGEVNLPELPDAVPGHEGGRAEDDGVDEEGVEDADGEEGVAAADEPRLGEEAPPPAARASERGGGAV